jgi:hypothetical protein
MVAPLTADQLEGGIRNALEAGDVGAARDFLRVLVGIDPIRAEKLWLAWLADDDGGETNGEARPDGGGGGAAPAENAAGGGPFFGAGGDPR